MPTLVVCALTPHPTDVTKCFDDGVDTACDAVLSSTYLDSAARHARSERSFEFALDAVAAPVCSAKSQDALAVLPVSSG